MDSHDRKLRSEEEPLYWAELIPEQFVWYREQIAALKALGAKETSLIFIFRCIPIGMPFTLPKRKR